MSIETEINRISTNVSDTLSAISEMGGEVPDGATSDDMASGVRSIPVGAKIDDTTPSSTTTYSSSKIESEISKLNEANAAQDTEIAKKVNDADLAKVAKSGSYNDLTSKPTIPTVPSALKNPNALTFTGAVSATYDGSAPVSVEIPAGGSGSYTLPVASPTTLGGVMPVAKTDEMTQAVGVDDAGGLWTMAGGSSGGYAIDTLLDVTVEEEVQYIYQALDGSHRYYQIRVWAETKPSSQNTSDLALNIKLNPTEGNLWSGVHVGIMQSICSKSTNYWGDLIVFLGPNRSECIYGRYNNQQNGNSNMNYHFMFRSSSWNVDTPVKSIRIDVGNWQGWLGVGTHILIQGVRA